MKILVLRPVRRKNYRQDGDKIRCGGRTRIEPESNLQAATGHVEKESQCESIKSESHQSRSSISKPAEPCLVEVCTRETRTYHQSSFPLFASPPNPNILLFRAITPGPPALASPSPPPILGLLPPPIPIVPSPLPGPPLSLTVLLGGGGGLSPPPPGLPGNNPPPTPRPGEPKPALVGLLAPPIEGK
jgi:hypothetical protein